MTARVRGLSSGKVLRAAALALALGGFVAAAAEAKPRPRGAPKGKSASTTKSLALSSTPINLNTIGKPGLSPLPVLSSDAKWAILNFRQSGPYADAADFASKVCSRVKVDFGTTDVQIGSAVLTGFKCLTPASGSYQANGAVHAYALPVEVTGSDTIPPAPPG